MTAQDAAVAPRDEPTQHVVHLALTFEVEDAGRLLLEFAEVAAPTVARRRTLEGPLVHHLTASIDADLLELHGIRHVATGLLRTRDSVRSDAADGARHPHHDTPTSLADELGHRGPGRVRAFLRAPDDEGPAFAHRRSSHWRLDAEDAERVRRRFDDGARGAPRA